MLTQIMGLHHITSIASGAQVNNAFFTKLLGLRRVKTTVNFDAPQVYHLYYGNARGDQGSCITYFPFEGRARGRPGAGEVARVAFSVPVGSLPDWEARLRAHDVQGISRDKRFGENRLIFDGPDGETFALVEAEDARPPWTADDIGPDMAIRGFYSAGLRVSDGAEMVRLMEFMGYEVIGKEGDLVRMAVPDGNGANFVDVETTGDGPASQGAGSVHHIAFAVRDRAAQLEVRDALSAAGHRVTEVKDRNYFWAIYFRSPGGVLFEVATLEPGFDADEDLDALGSALKLPPQHAHLREDLVANHLAPLQGVSPDA